MVALFPLRTKRPQATVPGCVRRSHTTYTFSVAHTGRLRIRVGIVGPELYTWARILRTPRAPPVHLTLQMLTHFGTTSANSGGGQ